MAGNDSAFSVHPRIAADSIALGDLPLCHLRLMNDAHYPWLVLLPRRPAIVEIIDLPEEEQLQLMRDIALASRALKALTGCEKLNVAALGNMVPQLHIHVVARNSGDATWPGPVWGRLPAQHYAPDAARRMIERLTKVLEL